MWPLRQSTAGQIVPLGPFVQFDDDTEQIIAAESLTIANTDVRLFKSGATTEVGKNSGGATHLAAGRYRVTLDAIDTETAGPLRISVWVAGTLPVWLDAVVLPAEVYDALVDDAGGGLLVRLPDGAIKAASIEAGALAGKGDWVTAPPPAAETVASQVRTELTPELARIDVAISSRSTLTAPQVWGHSTRTLTATADPAGVTDLLSRLTAARAAYLDKLNVTGNLSTFDHQTHTVTLGQQFPEHFSSLAIDGDGRVTTANPAAVVGSLHTAEDVANLILASPANKLATNASGEVIASNMRGTDGALTAAAYTAPINSAIVAIQAKTDNLPDNPASTADVQVNFDPTITVHPTVLASESVTAIAAPILTAIDEIETGGTAPSVDAIAERLLADPANKLLTDSSGRVTAANVSEGVGQYQITVSLNAGASGVENVLITIPGTLRRYLTDAFGIARIPADSGTYDLRITPPPGYEPVEDVTVTVAGGDQQVPVELVPRAIVIDPPAGTCAFTVRVASQSGRTLADIPVMAKLPQGYAVTTDTLNLNTTESQPTDSEGLATLILLRNQPYDLTAKRPDQGAVTLRIRTPDAEQATLSQVIQV